MNDQYPELFKYLALVAAKDNSMIALCLAVVAVAAWLINARFLWPKLLPAFRFLLVALVYGSLALLVFRG